MQQRQMWTATAVVILTLIGGTWSVGQNMATRKDVAGLATTTREDVERVREDVERVREDVERVRADVERVRAEIRTNREATEVRFDELRTEIRAAQESANSQMEELRSYIVQHLNQHSRDDE